MQYGSGACQAQDADGVSAQAQEAVRLATRMQHAAVGHLSAVQMQRQFAERELRLSALQYAMDLARLGGGHTDAAQVLTNALAFETYLRDAAP